MLDLRKLDMEYQSWTARRKWQVEPWGIVLKAGQWYLVARGHGKTRIFNIADIRALEAGSDACIVPQDFNLAEWWRNTTALFEDRLRPGRAILRASPIGLQRLRLLGDFAGRAVAAALPPDEEGWSELTLPIESIDSAAPMLLGIGPELDVIEPAALRAAVLGLAAAVVGRIEGGEV